uniref:NR LBD domain-containing protein n=1 Tax=Panagrolaimus sp. PS1159 TaxID=55785 RepID=A0AC35GYC3_9BILA
MSCDALIFPDGSMPIKRPIIHSHQKDIFERIVEPVKRIKITKEEYVLLKAIIFCSAKSDTISDEGKKILKIEFHRYSQLLMNHVQAKYGDAPGAVRYSQILSVMEAMIYFTQKGKEFHFFLGTSSRHFRYALPLVDQINIQS